MKLCVSAMLLVIASIGTSNAQFSRLHVRTTSPSALGITTSNHANKVIGLYHDGNTGIISSTVINGSTEYTPLVFTTGGLPRLVITAEGQVGIKTTGVLTADFTVGGIIHAREVKVTVGAGADYVFDNEYQLIPLQDLKVYLKNNKHLPDVAPAADMERNGINLSEMNITLLKKVEELTLYLIEQDSRVKSLQEQVFSLQQKLDSLNTK